MSVVILIITYYDRLLYVECCCDVECWVGWVVRMTMAAGIVDDARWLSWDVWIDYSSIWYN
jgi:hypothetical protein